MSNAEQKVIKKIEEWTRLPIVLLHLILQYCAENKHYETKPFLYWYIPTEALRAIVTDQKSLFVALRRGHLQQYDQNGAFLADSYWHLSQDYYWCSDILGIYEDKLIFAAHSVIKICNFYQQQIISSWNLPQSIVNIRGLITNEKKLYLTCRTLSQVLVCNLQSTATELQILQQFGDIKSGSGQNQFHTPWGLAMHQNFLYVSDCNNHRIKILKKDLGTVYDIWGQGPKESSDGYLCYPYGLCIANEIIYIGDQYSVHLYSLNGLFIQRLGDEEPKPSAVLSIIVWNDFLYTLDGNASRIQVFRPKKK